MTKNDEQILFDRELVDRLDEVQRSLDHFLREIHTAPDPISPVLSDKGIWFMTCPIIKTTSLRTAFAKLIARDVEERSGGKYRMTKVRATNSRFDFTLEGPGEVSITWAALSSVVVVPHFDKMIGIKKRLAELDLELEQLKREYREAAVIANSKEAMLANGYYTLYLRSVFSRKKFKADVAELDEEYKLNIEAIKTEIKTLTAQLTALDQDRGVIELLSFMNNHYLKFPRVTTLAAYERSLNLDQTKEATTDGT